VAHSFELPFLFTTNFVGLPSDEQEIAQNMRDAWYVEEKNAKKKKRHNQDHRASFVSFGVPSMPRVPNLSWVQTDIFFVFLFFCGSKYA
jgi:hypothetical protein